MRGTSFQPRRISAKTLLAALAAVLILAHPARSRPAASADDPDSEQIAFAIPRVAGPGSQPEIVPPTPLGPADVALAKRVFADQAAGRMDEAAREAADLSSPLLDGPIEADRLLGPFHHSRPDELRAWLARYGTQADAPQIRALLTKRSPARERLPATDGPATLAPQAPLRNNSGAVGALGPSGAPAPASLRLHARSLLTAGLAAWREGKFTRALERFEQAARARGASASSHAAGAFWAARAELRLHNVTAYSRWLQSAAAERRTFHGIIARRILGHASGLDAGHETLSQADVDALGAIPRAERAFALLQVGQTALAEAELRALWPEVADSAPLRRAVLLAAAAANLTDLATQLSGLVEEADGVLPDPLRVAVPNLEPAGGFVIDKALIYGLTRTESNFNARAVSPAGARGLMQIMPTTARAVSGDPGLTPAALHDPAVNLSVGQHLLLKLASLPSIGGSLIRLLGSYNAGAAGFAGAAAGLGETDDPILFIDSIPITETRGFVRRVLTNSWIYAARLGLPAPGLDDLAAGRWPRLDPENWTNPPGSLHGDGAVQLARSGG